jgi:hypothetical protein
LNEKKMSIIIKINYLSPYGLIIGGNRGKYNKTRNHLYKTADADLRREKEGGLAT